MVDLRVGCWVAAWILVGCSESSTSRDAFTGGTGGAAGASGDTGAAAGSSGDAAGSSGDAAAGSESELPVYFEPGSRLKPKVLASEDGVDVIDESSDGGWYDSELEFDCLFVPDPAGIERCFPRALVTGGAMYADAECTRPVLATGARSSCDALRYQYVLTDRGGCAWQGLRVGEELPPSTPLFSSDGGSCQPSVGTSELAPIYQLEEMPAEAFVGMHRGPRARAPGLDAYVREGDDGSWQIIGHFDAARQAACFGLPSALSPHSECLPSFASSFGFADSTCQTRVADVRQSSCDTEQPTAILDARLDPNACPTGYDLELFEIDAARETTRHEVDASGACATSTIQPGGEFYVQGAPIELSTLPLLETLIVGSGAVRARFSGFGGVPYMPATYTGPSLVDEAGDACQPFEFPDGSLRCVPSAFAATGPAAFAYEDASCSGAPVVPWFPNPLCLTDVPLPGGVIFPDQTTKCLQRLTLTEVVAVVGKSDSSTFYAKDPATGACQTVPASSPAPTYLRLGAALPPAQFGLMERTIRP